MNRIKVYFIFYESREHIFIYAPPLFMKKYFKTLITKLLWFQVARLRDKHQPIVIAVAGSIGKTSTKTAIATVLSEHLKVQWQSGNYNDSISVPLVFFGQKMPNIYNPVGWLKVFLSSELQVKGAYPYQVVVVELGSDKPGDLAEFNKYLSAQYGVLTAVTAEHMENFTDLDAVAEEELIIREIAETVLVDANAVDAKYIKKLNNYLTFGEGPQDCRITSKPLNAKLRRPATFTLKSGERYTLETPVLGKQGLPSMAAAVLLANKLELTDEEVLAGLVSIQPVHGRMYPLRGDKQSLLIDDTYNASPQAVIAALKTLYEIPSKHKIAVLGQMNELGKHSKASHEEIGKFCDPKQLALVVTIGRDANKYIATEAEKRGCKVMRCPSPYHATDIVRPLLKKGTVVLAKGSQNGVFAEEAVKELLANRKDAKQLVHQSKKWLQLKEEQFQNV